MPQPTYQMLRDFMALPEPERIKAVQHPTLGPMLQDFLDAGGEGRRDILDTLRAQEQSISPSPVTPESARAEVGSFNPLDLLTHPGVGTTALRVAPNIIGQLLGGPIGGGIGAGAGELAAQAVEGQGFRWPTIALESGLGMIPGGKTGTTVLRNLVKRAAQGAVFGTGGGAARIGLEEGRLPTLDEFLTQGITGALLGGGLGGAESYLARRVPQPSAPPPPRPMKALPPAPPYETLIGEFDALPQAERARLLNLGPPREVPVSSGKPTGKPMIPEGVPAYQTDEQAILQARAAAEGRLPVAPAPQRPGRSSQSPRAQGPTAEQPPPVIPQLPQAPVATAPPSQQAPLTLEPPVSPDVTARMQGLRNTIEDARTSIPTGKQFYRDQDGNIVKTGNAGPLLPRFYEMFPELRDVPPGVSPKQLVDAIDKDEGNKVYQLVQDATTRRIAIEDAQDYQRFSRAWDEIATQPDPLMQRAAQSTNAVTQAERAYRAAEHQSVTGGTAAATRMAPVEYAGYQEGFGKVPGFHQYTLTEDLSPKLVKGSTVSAEALRKAGYEVPPPPPLHATQPPLLQTQATMPPEGLQAKAPQVEHGDLLAGLKPPEPTRQAGLPLEGTQELHAGLPIPPKVKEWAKRNLGSLGRAAAQTGRNVASEPASVTDRAASAEQRLRDVQQMLTQPRPPTASGVTAGARATTSTPPRAPIAPDTPLNELPRYYDTALANQNRTRPLLSGGYHGMNQIAEAAPSSARAFRGASNAEHAWNYAVTEAKDLIERVNPGAWDRFNQTMAQSQLNGSVRRWKDLARELAAADPHEVPDIYRERAGDALLSAGAEPYKVGEQIASRFKAATTDTGKLANAEKLQQHLVKTFTDASERVSSILPPAEYQSRLASPEFRQALAIWKNTIGNDLRAAHLQHNGHLLRSEYLGETGEYFPLTGKAAAERAAAGLRGPRPAGPYSQPGNPLNFRRSGLSPEYDLSTETLQRRIGSAGWAADNAKAIAQAEADGLIRKIPPGTPAEKIPRTYDFHGVTYRAERVGDHVMPSWVRDEIGPIFERFRRPGPPTGPLGWAANKIVGLNTQLGVDKFFHYINETGMLGAQAPTIGRTELGRTVGSLPGIKTAHAFTTLFNSLADAERPMVREMLRNGEWYPRFKDNGELTGMTRRDLAGRLTFRQAILRWKPNATPQELYEASTRFGEYNPQLASNMVRAIKQSPVFSPLAPFVTAGNAFVRNALGTLTMQGPGGAAARLTAAATGGVPAAIGTWVALHLGMTGKFPDPSDPDFKFLQVPYGDTPDGRTKYFNVGRAVSPLFNRGARASGVTGALETLARGGTSSQAFESALGDIVNAQTHPYTGPVVKVGTRLIAGVDPQIQFQGGGMNVRRAHPPMETLPGQLAANVKSAAEAVNPAVERISKPIERALGVPGGHDPTEGMSAVEQAAQALGLVSVSDNRQRTRMLHWSDKQTQRAARRAQR